MALADPQSISIGGAPISLPRTVADNRKGEFANADGNYTLTVSHALGKRNRRVVRLDYSKIAADPLQPATNLPYSMGTYLVVDTPKFGFNPTEVKAVIDGLLGYLTATSGARITQLLGGES